MTNHRCALVLLLAACGGGGKHDASVANAVAQANLIKVEWKAAQAGTDMVDVTLVVDGKPETIGQLNAAADDAAGTPETCSIAKAEPKLTRFTCGATPAYNYYDAELVDGSLVVTFVSGVEGEQDPARQERKEVKRVEVGGTALSVAPYQLPAKS